MTVLHQGIGAAPILRFYCLSVRAMFASQPIKFALLSPNDNGELI